MTTSTYSIPQTDIITTNPDTLGIGRTYVLKIKDLAEEDKPREKLLKYGPGNLSIHELLAVVLVTGSTKEDVMTMTSRAVREYGERALGVQTNAESLAHDLDIPLGKATQIVACAELGKRFFQKNIAGPAVLRTAKDVFTYARYMQRLPKEHLRGIYVNTHHRVIHDEVISIGTINANLVHPREVFRPAIEHGAAAVILVHNHPSGVVKASQADVDITTQLIAAGNIVGIHVIDHVIIGNNKFSSVEANYQT